MDSVPINFINNSDQIENNGPNSNQKDSLYDINFKVNISGSEILNANSLQCESNNLIGKQFKELPKTQSDPLPRKTSKRKKKKEINRVNLDFDKHKSEELTKEERQLRRQTFRFNSKSRSFNNEDIQKDLNKFSKETFNEAKLERTLSATKVRKGTLTRKPKDKEAIKKNIEQVKDAINTIQQNHNFTKLENSKEQKDNNSQWVKDLINLRLFYQSDAKNKEIVELIDNEVASINSSQIINDYVNTLATINHSKPINIDQFTQTLYTHTLKHFNSIDHLSERLTRLAFYLPNEFSESLERNLTRNLHLPILLNYCFIRYEHLSRHKFEEVGEEKQARIMFGNHIGKYLDERNSVKNDVDQFFKNIFEQEIKHALSNTSKKNPAVETIYREEHYLSFTILKGYERNCFPKKINSFINTCESEYFKTKYTGGIPAIFKIKDKNESKKLIQKEFIRAFDMSIAHLIFNPLPLQLANILRIFREQISINFDMNAYPDLDLKLAANVFILRLVGSVVTHRIIQEQTEIKKNRENFGAELFLQFNKLLAKFLQFSTKETLQITSSDEDPNKNSSEVMGNYMKSPYDLTKEKFYKYIRNQTLSIN